MSRQRLAIRRPSWPYDPLMSIITTSGALLVILGVLISYAFLTPEPTRRAPMPEGDYFGHWLCLETSAYGECITKPVKRFTPVYPKNHTP